MMQQKETPLAEKSGFIPSGLLDGTYPIIRADRERGGFRMIAFLKELLYGKPEEQIMDAEYEPYRDELRLAGLSEENLRKMDPDDRVAALEQAHLDPYDYIYLACG